MTLTQTFQKTIQQFPHCGVGFIQYDASCTFRPYSELYQEALCILKGLQEQNLAIGDPILLTLSRQEDWIPAFWACLLGGFLPVPLQAPIIFYEEEPAFQKVLHVWERLEHPPLLLARPLQGREQQLFENSPIPNAACLALTELRQCTASTQIHEAQAQDLALIQFSSGSTGQAKGVMLTHHNILSNIYAILSRLRRLHFDHKQDSSLSWLPFSHDMGLIGFHLAPVVFGYSQYQINTLNFIKRPLLWLDSLSRYRSKISAAPNFSLSLVLEHAQRYPDKQWDLSSLELLYNGAEPISVDGMQAFIEQMAPHHFSAKAMFPVYGLAEASLAFSLPKVGTKPIVQHFDQERLQTEQRAAAPRSKTRKTKAMVSVGRPLKGARVRIVDEQDQILKAGRVGHIQIQGDFVSSGYYHDPSATKAAFCGKWLRTGDMGFLYKQDLYIAGRAKEVIFIYGQNYHVHDLESIAQKVEGVRARSVIACGCFDEQEGRDLVLLFCVTTKTESLAPLALRIQRRLQSELRLKVDALIPISSRHLPKTTSGKVKRYLLSQQFESGVFQEAIEAFQQELEAEKVKQREHCILPQTPTEKLLHRELCQFLHIEESLLSIDIPLQEFGISSLQAFQLLQKLEQRYHLLLTPKHFEQHPTIQKLAQYIDANPLRIRQPGGLFRG